MTTKTGSKITKRPSSKATAPAQPVADSKANDFIGGAPDSVKLPKVKKGLMRGKRDQISHTLPPGLLDKVDLMAEAKGISRAGVINLAISEFLEKQK